MAAARNQIWLVRHGETEWSRAGKHTSRTDMPLTETGQRQARALGQRLAGCSFALVLTSPMSRARETCRLAGYGDVAQVTDDLHEWNYGIYEGRSTPEIRKEQPGWSIWTTAVTGGESLEQVGERVLRVVDRAVAAEGDVALFAHAHVLRILAARWLGLPAAGGRLFALGAAAISVLGWDHDTRALDVWNRDWRLAVDPNS
jgi:probable phosphoglycerate mutase